MADGPAFVYPTRIAFHQADPAGVLFFGRYAELWQSAYEGFITSLGIAYDAWFGQTQHSTPIRRVEVDHLAPILAGETVDVRVTVARVGATSFTLAMTACGADTPADVRARAAITFVHTAPAADGRFMPTDLPADVRLLLSDAMAKS